MGESSLNSLERAAMLVSEVLSVSSTENLEGEVEPLVAVKPPDSSAPSLVSSPSLGDAGVSVAPEPEKEDAELDADREVSRAWNSLTPRPMNFFWEQDFWGNFMSSSVGAVDALTDESFTRPQLFDSLTVETTALSTVQLPPQRPAYASFHHVVKNVQPGWRSVMLIGKGVLGAVVVWLKPGVSQRRLSQKS